MQNLKYFNTLSENLMVHFDSSQELVFFLRNFCDHLKKVKPKFPN